MARRRRAGLMTAAAISVGALALGGCGTSAASSGSSGGSASSGHSTGSGNAAALQLVTPGTLTVGIAAIYPPYTFLKPGTKTPTGFEIDVTNAIAAKLGLKPSYANVAFSSLIPGVESKRFDVATTGIGDTAVREKQDAFIDYEQSHPALLVAKKSVASIHGLADLCGRSVAVVKGSQPEPIIQAQAAKCTREGKAKLNILLYPDHPTAVLAVQSGRADATSADLATVAYQAKQLSNQFVFVDAKTPSSPLGFVASKQNPALQNALLNALKTLYSNDTMKKIYTKWGVPQMLLPAPGINLATKQ
ncbi:ABC transporter substrate-binding protein [Leekyejoonella antrihumi]|nr:ABC transporter substrate-binding protein [Leekyejoonella antrihumi]